MSVMDASKEHTLILIKPDAYRRGLVGQILARFERKGYVIAGLRVVHASEDLLRRHYAEHVKKHFYGPMEQYMRSAPIVAVCLEGEQVVAGARTLAGPTWPTNAEAGTIRGDFGRDWGTEYVQNVIHASDSPASADREIAIWFPDAAL